MAFPRKNRLVGARVFANVFNRGKTIRFLGGVLKYTPNNKNTPRIAIIVSAKHFAGATERNRIKRLIAAKMYPAITGGLGYDVIVIVQKDYSSDPASVTGPLHHLLLK